MEILAIGIWILIAWWNVSIAKKNGRNPIWAAIWGVLFGLLAVIIYSIMGKTNEKEDADFARRMSAVAPGQMANKKESKQ